MAHDSFARRARRITSWDLFCRVIDNHGDIGVCWRLARQLKQEHGHTVRLWVDALHAFARLCPALDASAAAQCVDGIDIRHWTDDARVAALLDADAHPMPHDAVIEAFACEIPQPILQRMAQAARHGRAPAWINLEYLSAEPWVAAHHAMPSPHPSLPLIKHFFFPGFVRGTGGVLREARLSARRTAFANDPAAHPMLWRRLSVDDLIRAAPHALRISLFAYANPMLNALLAQWRASAQPILCLVPEGLAAAQIAELHGHAAPPTAGTRWSLGNLTLAIVPFLAQDEYDWLLWACDINFVRGEDSFVRAQWAQHPFVWHIYPQSGNAHLAKLDAFLARYASALPQAAARALIAFWHAWNGRPETLDWPAFATALPALRDHAPQWERSLSQPGDLAANLVTFCEIL